MLLLTVQLLQNNASILVISSKCVDNGVNVCWFAFLEFIEMTARLLVRLLPLLFRRYVFKSFRHEKLLLAGSCHDRQGNSNASKYI